MTICGSASHGTSCPADLKGLQPPEQYGVVSQHQTFCGNLSLCGFCKLTTLQYQCHIEGKPSREHRPQARHTITLYSIFLRNHLSCHRRRNGVLAQGKLTTALETHDTGEIHVFRVIRINFPPFNQDMIPWFTTQVCICCYYVVGMFPVTQIKANGKFPLPLPNRSRLWPSKWLAAKAKQNPSQSQVDPSPGNIRVSMALLVLSKLLTLAHGVNSQSHITLFQ